MAKKYILSAMALAALTLSSLTTATPIPNPLLSQPLALSKTHTPSLAKRSPAIIITECTVANSFAVTFDDGPGAYTNELLDYLDIKQIKVTFFVNGLNYNNILDPHFSAVVKRAFDAGHQIGSHTWSHADISLSATDIDGEMTKLDDALKGIIGKRPVYMRPPYGNTSPAALDYLGAHGYKVINWNVDTNDWQHPLDFKKDLEAYKAALQNANAHSKTYISLQHDAEPGTAQVWSKMAIEYVLSKGFNIVPVGTCLGDTTGWYRD
ncbi:hypothetical protein BG005_005906 [Podila minutissima]|nr:hypothetical protein BG005_005906 [Podila minutissima]